MDTAASRPSAMASTTDPGPVTASPAAKILAARFAGLGVRALGGDFGFWPIATTTVSADGDKLQVSSS